MAASVLLVEGSQDLRTIYGTMLAHLGVELVEAATAAEAMRHVRERAPAVIVLSSRLPDGDGWQLAALLAREARTSAVPIVLLTERGEYPPAHGAGPVLLSRPVEPRSLYEAVRDLIGSGGERRPQQTIA